MMSGQAENVAIVTQQLTKSYGKVKALQGVDLTVYRGEIFGFLGPNGAGKTTTIRCLMDLIRPDNGTISIMGHDPQVNPVVVKTNSGYLPGELHLNANLTAEKQLRYFNDLRGGQAEWSFIRQLADRLDLDLKRPIKNLSKGNKQKVGVIQALMHRPQLLLLDEPTGGLDPLMQQEVLNLIREAKEAGTTVFFSSHVMSEVEAIAERVGIIRQGKIVEVAETAALTERSLVQATVHFQKPVDCDILAGLSNVKMISQDDGLTATLQVWGEMDDLIKTLAAYPVSSLETVRPSLEEVFLEYYKSEPDNKEVVDHVH
jgi:ABC-2 type transport system ATP-binding protein